MMLTVFCPELVVLTKQTGGVLIDGTPYSKTWSGLVLFSMVFYVASYATGLGNVPWQQAELFNLDGARQWSLTCISQSLTRLASPRYRYIASNGNKLVRQPNYRRNVPLPN